MGHPLTLEAAYQAMALFASFVGIPAGIWFGRYCMSPNWRWWQVLLFTPWLCLACFELMVLEHIA